MRIVCRRLVVPVVAVSLLATGQLAAEGKSAPRRTTTLTVSGSRHVSMPASMRPGVARLYLRSSHSVYVLRSRHGAGSSALVKDWNASTATAFERDFTTMAHMPSHTTTVTTLPRGTYYAIEGEIGKLSAALAKRFVVTGRAWNVARPKSVAVTIGTSQTMRSPASLPAHTFTHIVNNSSHPQEVLLYSYHATKAQLSAFLAHPSLSGLARIGKPARALTFFDGHRSLYTDSRPSRGSYLIVNFSYGKGTAPRFTKGQAHVLAVR